MREREKKKRHSNASEHAVESGKKCRETMRERAATRADGGKKQKQGRESAQDEALWQESRNRC